MSAPRIILATLPSFCQKLSTIGGNFVTFRRSLLTFGCYNLISIPWGSSGEDLSHGGSGFVRLLSRGMKTFLSTADEGLTVLG